MSTQTQQAPPQQNAAPPTNAAQGQQQVFPMPPMVPPSTFPLFGTGVMPQQPAPTGVALWVGNLSPKVDESSLYNAFQKIGSNVIQVKIVRDRVSQQPRGYGYVNFASRDEAEKALNELKHQELEGKPLRVMFSIPDKKKRNNPKANVYVKNLPLDVDANTVESTFEKYGPILSCYVPLDEKKQCRGYGYVQFENEDDARKAIEKANKKKVKGIRKGGDDKPSELELIVELYKPKSERTDAQSTFTNVFVKNITPEFASEEKIKEVFSKFGTITSVFFNVHKNKNGEELPFAFLNFEKHDDAVKAINDLHGTSNGDASTWYVSRAQTKDERRKYLEQQRKSAATQFKFNVFVKYLNPETTEETLKQFFDTPSNNIVSVKIPRDAEGKSKEYGYVAFSSEQEAREAVLKTDKDLDGSRLYIGHHMTREAREAEKKRKFFSQPQQSYPQMQQWWMWQQQMQQMFPRFGMPVPQLGGRGNARLPAGPAGFRRFPPQGQPQGQPQGRVNMRMMVPPGNMHMPPMGMQQPPMVQQPQQQQQQQQPQQQQPQQQQPQVALDSKFTSELITMTRDQQRTILGEKLYPLVDKIDSSRAPKITGMLLDAEPSSLVELLNDPEALRKRVSEAQAVLDKASS